MVFAACVLGLALAGLLAAAVEVLAEGLGEALGDSLAAAGGESDGDGDAAGEVPAAVAGGGALASCAGFVPQDVSSAADRTTVVASTVDPLKTFTRIGDQPPLTVLRRRSVILRPAYGGTVRGAFAGANPGPPPVPGHLPHAQGQLRR